MRVIKRPTVKRTTTKTSSSTTKPSSSSSSSSSNSSNTNTSYNDILNKLNDYVLKSSIANFVTNETLASAISNIKQCNCEQSTNTTPSQTTDNTALNDLIRKLNNYGYFPYDVPGKETIVTEFFPAAQTRDNGNLTGLQPHKIPIPENEEMIVYLIRTETSLKDYDYSNYILIDYNGNRVPVSETPYKTYFNGEYILPSIINTPLATLHNNVYSIEYFIDHTKLGQDANNAGVSVDLGVNYNGGETWIGAGVQQCVAEFVSGSTLGKTKNGITCTFVGGYSGSGHYISGETITLTLPENISLVNNLPNGSYTITANGNIITIKLAEKNANGDIIQYYGVFTKQIIIADSSTKRYVIKLNGETSVLPPY